ncbi:MAG TPA: hypothetical protein VJ417_13120, partial [Candidatus Glassbacteria bacterium]|nr:hypothetical protein [Candidatus Glassbacteria bacterium]
GFGLRPRWVTLSTLAMLGLVADGRAEGASGKTEKAPLGAGSGSPAVLVAKYSPPWLTTAILQGEFLRLFRTVGLAAGEDGLLTTAQLLEALFPSVSYFQDNFAGTLVLACLCGLGANSAALAEAVESELHLRTEPAMPASGVLLAGRDPWQTEQQFAALLGIVWGQRLG